MKVGIIGAGRVGCAFSLALAYKKIEIAGAYSKNPNSADNLNKRLALSNFKDLSIEELVTMSNVLLITVPDSEISNTVNQIIEVCPESEIAGKVFMHCSGAATSVLLRPLEAAGAYIGSLHPAQTFPDRENSWKNMIGIYFGYEGSQEAGKHAANIVEKLDGIMLILGADTKPLYHAAACVISNYVVTLSHFAGDLMEAAGIDRAAGMKAFNPLLTSTATNICEMGSIKALTGPISRGDAGTLEEHLHAIEGIKKDTGDTKTEAAADAVDLYKSIGRATVRLAVIKGSINEEKAEEMMELLAD